MSKTFTRKCGECLHAKPIIVNRDYICTKQGVVSENYLCKKFVPNPTAQKTCLECLFFSLHSAVYTSYRNSPNEAANETLYETLNRNSNETLNGTINENSIETINETVNEAVKTGEGSCSLFTRRTYIGNQKQACQLFSQKEEICTQSTG